MRAWLRSRAWSASSARSPRARTSGAKVSPWPTRVTRTARKAQNSSSSRSGNGAPLSVVSGSVKIAARRDDAAGAGPAEDDDLPAASRPLGGGRDPAVVGLAVARRGPGRSSRSVQRLGQVLGEPQPQRPEQQHDADGDRRGDDDGRGGVVAEAVDDGGQLLADQQEDEALEQEVDQPPDGVGLQPARARGPARVVVADDQPGDDDREDAGDVHRLAEQVGDERRRERDRVRRQRVAAQPAQRPDGVGDRHPGRDAADGGEQELADGGRGRRSRRPGPRRSRRARMVSAVASLSRPSPWISVISRGGRPAFRPDGEGGDRVGRRDGGAERDAGGQGRAGDEQREADADHQRGGQDQQHRQADHRAQVAADRRPARSPAPRCRAAAAARASGRGRGPA